MAAKSITSAIAYDAFVVHAAADDWFVHGYLLGQLGLARDRVLTLSELELGEMITSEIERGIRSSRVTIVVLSSTYVNDRWAVFGEQIASYASVTRQLPGVVLPLLLEDCELPPRIQALVKLDFRVPELDVWQAQIDRLRGYLDRQASTEPQLGCPYPGMRPFAECDAGRFFGREVEIDRMIRWLRHHRREIYIIGPSGSGKSSLVAAGLVPRLVEGVSGLPSFQVQTLRPGELPLDRLASVLGCARVEDCADPAAAALSLLRRRAGGESLLLIIDQLEEVFALASEHQRRGFFEAIRSLHGCPRCALIFTLRADFYGEFMTSPLWATLDRARRIDLGPLGEGVLRIVIERPARELGVYFQPELTSRLVDDAAHQPGALPLLQETLFLLWAKRRGRSLTLAEYQALGDGDGTRTGLAFAVKEHADGVLASLTESRRAIALRILLRLVSFGEGRDDTRRQQPRNALRSHGEDAADFDAILQQLVDHRLVTVSGDDQHGDVRVDLSHEVLVRVWPALTGWIRTWRAHEQRRRALEAAAAGWQLRGSGDGGLLDPVELTEATAWREAAATTLGQTRDLAAFLASSEAAQIRTAQQQQQAREDQERERRARERQLAESAQLYQETARQRLIEVERPLEALPYLVAAREAVEACGTVPSSSLRMLFAEATRNLPISLPLVHHKSVMYAAFSPDGRHVVTASRDRTSRVWDAASGAPLCSPFVHQGHVVSAMFGPDGTKVVTASNDRTAHVWQIEDGSSLACSPPLPHDDRVMSAVFSPDGGCVVTASADGNARIWDSRSGQLRSPPCRHQNIVSSVAFSPDGTRIATASFDRTVQVWDSRSGEPVLPPLVHRGRVVKVAFCPSGERIVSASADGTVRVWSAASGYPVTALLAHGDGVRIAAFSADASRVVTASADHMARVWDVESGRPLAPPLVHRGRVLGAAFSRCGTRVLTASQDGTARIWTTDTGRPLSPPLVHRDAVLCAAFAPDGTRVLTASADGTACVWDATAAQPAAPASVTASSRVELVAGRRPHVPDVAVSPGTLQHQGIIASAAFSPDGTRVVTGSHDRTARVWHASGEPLSPPLEHDDAVVHVAFSPGGGHVVTSSEDRTARIWDAESGWPIAPPLGHEGAVVCAAFSPDGTRIVTTSWDYTARIWDARSGKALSPPLVHQGVVGSAAFSADGMHLVTTSWDHTARVWDALTGQLLSAAFSHTDAVTPAAFSPDGTFLATASADCTARIWRTTSADPVCQLRGSGASSGLAHAGTVYSVAFSRDGARLVTASADHTARVWDASSGLPISPPLAHRGAVMSAEFAADGARVVTASWDHTAQVWDASTGKRLSHPLQHQDNVSSASFSADGTRVLTASHDHTARIWQLPLAVGTLPEWRSIAEHASPYSLVNGTLSTRPLPILPGSRYPTTQQGVPHVVTLAPRLATQPGRPRHDICDRRMSTQSKPKKAMRSRP